MQENSKYKTFTTKIRKNYQELRSLKSKVRGLLFDIQALCAARDAVSEQLFKHVELSPKEEKVLKNLTTDDSECWYGTLDKGLDLLMEKQVELCIKVSNIKVDIDVLEAKNKQLNKDQDVLGDKLRTEFHENHQEKMTGGIKTS